MSAVNTYPLNPDCKIDVGMPWAPPKSIMPRVEEIWSFEKKRRGNQLTNGQIYSLSGFRIDQISICISEYKYIVAKRRDPDLAAQGLNIRPLAVTGVLICADGVILGQRGSGVDGDVGLWEPAPAGGLSHRDPKVQVLEELQEELGIVPSNIISAEICGLVEDIESSVFDIVFRLHVDATEKDIRANYLESGSDEYSDIIIIKPYNIHSFLRERSNRLLPTLHAMLSVAKII